MMNSLTRSALLAASIVLFGIAPARLNDVYLSGLIGNWNVTGTTLGKQVSQTATGQWVLAHQFVLLRFKGAYEADVYIGYDAPRRRYVEHWIDVFGGSGATVVGYGERRGSTLAFLFEYPEGKFRNTMTYDARSDSWHIHYESQRRSGMWSEFGDELLEKQP
jgi:hypothetical protein